MKLQDLDKLSRFEPMALLLLRIVFAGLLVINQGWPTFQQFIAGSTEFPDPLNLGARTTMGLMVFTEFGDNAELRFLINF